MVTALNRFYAAKRGGPLPSAANGVDTSVAAGAKGRRKEAEKHAHTHTRGESEAHLHNKQLPAMIPAAPGLVQGAKGNAWQC